MHSEAEIRRAIRPLLDKYGELTTSEVKSKLDEVLVFDEDDKMMSQTRNEMKIIQRIGNIVAHQNCEKEYYSEGFIVDKSVKPAKFIAVVGVGPNIAPISQDEVIKRKDKEVKFRARKVNWSEKRLRNDEVGNMGEEYVIEFERDRVSLFDEDATNRIIHLSKCQGDGAGYDILSLTEEGTELKIEVKTTTGNLSTPFYMSENEKLFFEIHEDSGACIYRVYNFNTDTRRGDIKVISASELLNDYNFDPISYKVTKKSI